VTAVALHHRVDGPPDAAPLLMAGSLGTGLAMWEPQLPVLSAARRVIRFDHRGHGASPVVPGPYAIADLGGDVLALMDRLGVDRAAYCGLSIGGMVGQWLAINAPERIAELILICTAAFLPPPEGWLDRAATVRAAGTPAVVADAVVRRWFTAPYAEGHPEVVARHREMIAATSPEGYAGCCEAIAGLDLRAGLGAIGSPTLVIAGAQDPSIPADHGRAIATAVPGARLVVLDPAAHLASVERADAVTGLIVGHLAGHLAGSPSGEGPA
jgi:3-oxoadipate enol-lactonase